MTEDLDTSLRLYVYETFIAESQPPSRPQLAARLGISEEEVEKALTELAEAHVLVLDDAKNIAMAMPFSAAETHYKVTADDSAWWAPCAWDALGIPAVLKEGVTVLAQDPNGGEPWELEVPWHTPLPAETGFIHFAVPAANWWDDIGFT